MQKINLTDIVDDMFLNCSSDTTKLLAKTLTNGGGKPFIRAMFYNISIGAIFT